MSEPRKLCRSCGKRLGCLSCGVDLRDHEKPEGFCDLCVKAMGGYIR